jgi:Zn-dependent protease
MLGDVTAKREGRLTLNPLAHIDPVYTLGLPILLILIGSPIVFGAAKPVPFNPYAVRYGKWGAALIAVAGPASNFLMAVFGAIWLRIFPIQGLGQQFLVMFVVTNLAFFLFNMIPFPPLDGSRVLYAIAPPKITNMNMKTPVSP